MTMKIQSIAEKGNLEKERVVIRVVKPIDAGEYLLLCTGFSNGSVNTGVVATFWFPDKEVNTDDLVVVYTKSGNPSEKQLDGGRKAHFFYWGRSNPLWGPAEKGVVLLHAPVWESKSTSEV